MNVYGDPLATSPGELVAILLLIVVGWVAGVTVATAAIGIGFWLWDRLDRKRRP